MDRSAEVFAYGLEFQPVRFVNQFSISPEDLFSVTSGITYANDRYYVITWHNDIAYVSERGRRDAASDFELGDIVSKADGITYAKGRFYVVDEWGSQIHVISPP